MSPLKKGTSREVINQNIIELIDAGHPVNQAVKIAHVVADKPKKKRKKK